MANSKYGVLCNIINIGNVNPNIENEINFIQQQLLSPDSSSLNANWTYLGSKNIPKLGMKKCGKIFLKLS